MLTSIFMMYCKMPLSSDHLNGGSLHGSAGLALLDTLDMGGPSSPTLQMLGVSVSKIADGLGSKFLLTQFLETRIRTEEGVQMEWVSDNTMRNN